MQNTTCELLCYSHRIPHDIDNFCLSQGDGYSLSTYPLEDLPQQYCYCACECRARRARHSRSTPANLTMSVYH